MGGNSASHPPNRKLQACWDASVVGVEALIFCRGSKTASTGFFFFSAVACSNVESIGSVAFSLDRSWNDGTAGSIPQTGGDMSITTAGSHAAQWALAISSLRAARRFTAASHTIYDSMVVGMSCRIWTAALMCRAEQASRLAAREDRGMQARKKAGRRTSFSRFSGLRTALFSLLSFLFCFCGGGRRRATGCSG